MGDSHGDSQMRSSSLELAGGGRELKHNWGKDSTNLQGEDALREVWGRKVQDMLQGDEDKEDEGKWIGARDKAKTVRARHKGTLHTTDLVRDEGEEMRAPGRRHGDIHLSEVCSGHSHVQQQLAKRRQDLQNHA